MRGNIFLAISKRIVFFLFVGFILSQLIFQFFNFLEAFLSLFLIKIHFILHLKKLLLHQLFHLFEMQDLLLILRTNLFFFLLQQLVFVYQLFDLFLPLRYCFHKLFHLLFQFYFVFVTNLYFLCVGIYLFKEITYFMLKLC